MGRRILKSLRRSREDKPFAVQIEIDDGIPRDEATVFVSSTKEKEAAIEQKVGTVSDASEEILDQRDASPSPRQPYVPPKIWAEDFDSDSDSDNDGQKNACWHFNFGGTSKRRIQRRNEIAYAAKNQESRDEHSDGFCGIFDCDGGYHDAHDEPYERDLDFLDYDEQPIKSKDSRRSSRKKGSKREERQSSPETVVTSVLSDSSCSFDDCIRDESHAEAETQGKDDEQEGVEYTLDDMHSSYWMMAAQTKDVDLERKTKKKRSTRRLLKRAMKGRKPKRDTVSAIVAEDSEDEHTFRSRSMESTSTTGDATVISIKHVVSSVIDSIKEPRDWQGERRDIDFPDDKPTDDEPIDSPSTLVYDAIPRISSNDESKFPDEGKTTPVSTNGDADVVNHDFATDQQATTEEQQASPTSIVGSSNDYVYEPLNMGDNESVSEDEDSVKPTKQVVPKANPPDLLNQVVNVVEAGIKLFIFPEIQQTRKRLSTKRVSFAPDVIFNDAYEDHDYSMDYSYDEPEFGEDSFDEEMYYSCSAENDDDDENEEAFFDDEPLPSKNFPKKPMKRDSPELPATSFDEPREPPIEACESDDENSFDEDNHSVSNIGGYAFDADIRDVDDEILDFDDCADLATKVSSEDAFEFSGKDADRGVESDDGSLLDYTTIEEMELERANTPFDPTMIPSESLHPAAIEQVEVKRVVFEPKSVPEEKDIVHEEDTKRLEGRATDDELPMSSYIEKDPTDSSPSWDDSAIEPSKSPHPVIGISRTLAHAKPVKKDIREWNEDEDNDFRTSKTDLKPPHSAQEDDVCVVMAEQERTSLPRVVLRNPTRKKVDLIERYLDISVSHDKSTELLDECDILSVTETPIVEPERGAGRPEKEEKSPLSDSFDIDTLAIDSSDDEAEHPSTTDNDAAKNTNLADWLHEPETKHGPSIAATFQKKSNAAEGAWPSPPSLSEWESVEGREPFGDGFCSPEMLAPEDEKFISSARHRVTSTRKARISDKKESLQLSLQGFARARDTSSDWAKFNNAPFQDLEEAPFDEV